jgi:hypothetical protein
MSYPIRQAATYLAPLREGGSLPAVVEDTEGDLWVVKFRGAGQGPKSLVAELIVGALAETLGLRAPGLSLVELDEAFGQGERDAEIRDLLKMSTGMNVGLRYLDGAFNLDPVAAEDLIDPEFAARVVWLDALVVNPDRTARNPNLMVHEGRLWLIDHGAALFDHHDWSRVTEDRTRRPFTPISQHVLLARAGSIEGADLACAPLVSDERIREILAGIPDVLLEEPAFGSAEAPAPDDVREDYRLWLTRRMEPPRAWVDEAERARRADRPPERLVARR